jgi:endonuclease YncB( thermonuclease family)
MKASLRSISPLIILAMLIISKIGFANEYYVTEVMDGGTIKVVYGDNKDLTVRLVGIDAPEASPKKDDSDQPFSNQATNRLASLVLNRIVEIKFYGSGGHDRTLGEVYVGDKNINIEMINNGLAKTCRDNPVDGIDVEKYSHAESVARKDNRGMWVEGEKHVSTAKLSGHQENSSGPDVDSFLKVLFVMMLNGPPK